MKPSEVLRAARKLIERPENWCKQHRIVDLPGGQFAYCVLGAIEHAPGGGVLDQSPWHAKNWFARAIHSPSIGEWNDVSRRNHPEVLAAFDRAIALAEAEESPASELEWGRGG